MNAPRRRGRPLVGAARACSRARACWGSSFSHANCFSLLSGFVAGSRGGPADACACAHPHRQGPPEPSFAPQGRPGDFGPPQPPAFPRLSQLGSSPGGSFDFNPLQARWRRAAPRRTPLQQWRARDGCGGPRRCGCGARAAAACTGVRLTHSHAAPGAQFPSQQPQHTTSSGRHVRPTAAAGGYEEMPHAGTAGGHTPRAAAKDARASFRPQQTAHAADDSNKKGCSSTYRGVRQRPWGRYGFAALP